MIFMPKNKNLLDRLIYLDPDFVSSKYEEIKGVSPTTQFTRTEGMKADGKFTILSAGVHSQEAKTFSLSSYQMLKAIYDELERYPSFDPAKFANYQGTQTVWLEGQLTTGEWSFPGAPESSIYKNFELHAEVARYSFIVQAEYFRSGFGGLLTAFSALKRDIGVPVKVLARVFYLVENIPSFVACPYLIFEP